MLDELRPGETARNRRLMSKREVKIAAVEWAISALLAVEARDKKERKEPENAKLKEFFQSPVLAWV